MRRTLIGLLVVLPLLAGGVAQAQQYPPGEGDLVLDSTVVAAGGAVRIQGECPADSTGTITLGGRHLGTVQADADGSIDTSVTIPLDVAPGTYTLRLECQASVLSAELSVVASAADLPRTGAESTISLTQMGIALLLVGAGVVFVVRRRRSTAASHTAA